MRRIRAGEVGWPLPRRRSGQRIAPRGRRIDYRPSPAAEVALDALVARWGTSQQGVIERAVVEAGTK